MEKQDLALPGSTDMVVVVVLALGWSPASSGHPG